MKTKKYSFTDSVALLRQFAVVTIAVIDFVYMIKRGGCDDDDEA